MATDLADLTNTKFPVCVSKGLQKLEDLLKLPSSTKVHEAQQSVVDDYIFYFRDTQNLGPIDELQIYRAIYQHLAQITDPAARNLFFMTLFPAVGNDARTNFKTRLLSALVSFALVTHNISVLEATAVWMQQVGCLSTRCSQVCQILLVDYFQKKDLTKPHFQKAVQALPTGTPLFTSNMVTVLAQIFAKLGTTEFCEAPPQYLIEVVIEWCRDVPSVLLSPLTSPVHGISLPMVPVLPVGPLTKWCVEAPFIYDSSDKKHGKLFSEMHLLLLQTIQSVSSIQPPLLKPGVLLAEHLRSIVDVLCLRLNDQNADHDACELALNRFAQITLVALNTGCVTGRTAELWASLRRLRFSTRLLDMLLASHSSK